MKNKVFPRGPYTRRHECRCMWCGHTFTTVREDADTCGGRCRGKVYRFRQRTGLDPETPPGELSVQTAIEELIAELFARERLRRMGRVAS